MNLDPFLEANVAIQIHLVTALIALVLGGAILFRKKGGKIHKLLGKSWVGIFAVTVISSAFISELQTFGRFSGIHLLTLFSAGGLVYAIIHVRRGKIEHHKRAMQGLYLGGLIGAGTLAFMPNRVLYRMFVSDGSFSAAGDISPTMIGLGSAGLIFLILLFADRFRRNSV